MVGVDLPVLPPVKPMLAKSTKTLPPQGAHDAGFLYEPKWDGLRRIWPCIRVLGEQPAQRLDQRRGPLRSDFPNEAVIDR